ncbi:MAG: carboxyl transferase domain-containing protein, partial [Sandaracinaceae bacterium]
MTQQQRYPVLRSKIDLGGDDFHENQLANQELVSSLSDALVKSREGGGEKYVERHRSKGKLLPRERIELLLDRDAHFLEVAPLAGHRVRGHASGASIVGGIGVVSGVECMISASEATVKGGAISELGVTKTLRLQEIAEQNGLPSINLIESAGADLPNQSKIFVRGGQSFRNLTQQ